MEIAQISQQFTEYYVARGFQSLPRASMLDPSIPMSFVMSAGLVQIETSLAHASHRSGNQFVLVQSCFRHFDLESVGRDGIHLSFFEMPGAFTFGPNNKIETIQRMWHLAVSVFGIDPNRIWVTYFKGGSIFHNNLPEDVNTRDIWLNLGIPSDRIIGLTGNYWIQGRGIENMLTPRKCGPNTEMFFDMGKNKSCGPNCAPGCSCGRFVEFSNSLFISHEMAKQINTLSTIPEPFTETVFGAERVSMILQNVPSVFDISSYKPIINMVREFTVKNDLPIMMMNTSECVIADHIKALYYLIADGAPPPGKDGRERIIKLLIRRVLAHMYVLGIDAPDFLSGLLDCAYSISSCGESEYDTKLRVIRYFNMEKLKFFETIHRGQYYFEKMLGENMGRTLSGMQIVKLEKKQGLPQSLVEVLLWENGLPFLEADYKQAINLWKQTMLN
jgi:alanyl-tRNA synthetase